MDNYIRTTIWVSSFFETTLKCLGKIKLHAQACFPVNVEIFLHSSYSVEHMGAANFDMFVLLKLGLYGFNLFQDGKQKVQCSWPYLVLILNY